VLKVLVRFGPMHGYGIALQVQHISEDVLRVKEGSLYPALQRTLVKGWVVAERKRSETNRRATYYFTDRQGAPATGSRDCGVCEGHPRDRACDPTGMR
jgi:DNA-binding PadR family transcriptional regulator